MDIPERLRLKLMLEPHPEGGFYRRTFTAPNGAFSSILFLLTKDNFSAFHKIGSDEQWNWFEGDSVIIHEIDLNGNYSQIELSGIRGKENYQYIVKAGHWFASESSGENGYALCGCTVVPAFDFSNFVLAEYAILTEQFPEHLQILKRLTRQ